MFGTLIALSLQAAAVAAPPPETLQGWTVANSADGCLVHTSQRAGTVLSVFALPEQEGIGFLLQNAKWTTLENGEVYPLSIRFDDGSEWPIPAIARTDIDEDGPGLFFAIRPRSEEGGRDFIEEFAGARGMTVANDGRTMDSLRLANSRGATVALAQCLSRMWGGQSNPFGNSEGAKTATRI